MTTLEATPTPWLFLAAMVKLYPSSWVKVFHQVRILIQGEWYHRGGRGLGGDGERITSKGPAKHLTRSGRVPGDVDLAAALRDCQDVGGWG